MKVQKLLKKSLLVASLLGAGVAQAGTVQSQFFSGFQQLSDNSAEYLSVDRGTVGIVDIGDVLSGIFTIETVEKAGFSTRNLGGASGNNELTGIFSAQVVGKSGGPGGFSFVFAPTATFATTYGAGAMVALFQDASNDYTRVLNGTCVDLATCVATASNGTPFMTLGFAGANDFWAALSITDNIGVIGNTPAPGNGGGYNLGLSILANTSGLAFGKVDCFFGSVDVCGSGSLLGKGGVGTPFQAFDDVNFTVNRIPEPASLALLGLGLLGVGVSRRSKKAA